MKAHLAKTTLFINEEGKAMVKTHKFNTGISISCGTGVSNRNSAYSFSLEVVRWDEFSKMEVEYKCKNYQKIYNEQLEKLRAERKKYNDLNN